MRGEIPFGELLYLVALFTMDFFFIGCIIDIIKIATGGFRDNVGAPLRR